jgi:hypothetical protein
VNTQQTPQSSLSASRPTSPSRQSQLRRSLKVKWLTYYRDNREWIAKLGVWIDDNGERRPSSSFILATLSVLEPRLAQLMPIVVELNSNADRVVQALGLNFTPDDELQRAIANGVLPEDGLLDDGLASDHQALTQGTGPEAEQPLRFLPSTASQPFVNTQMTIHKPMVHESTVHEPTIHESNHESKFHEPTVSRGEGFSPMPHSTVIHAPGYPSSPDSDPSVSHVTIHHVEPSHATLQDSVDLYLDRSTERYHDSEQPLGIDSHQGIESDNQANDDPSQEKDSLHADRRDDDRWDDERREPGHQERGHQEQGRSPHEVAAQTDEACSGMGQVDPFQTIRNIDIRI